MSLSRKNPSLAKALVPEVIHLLGDLITIVIAALRVLRWLRGRNFRVISRARRGGAIIIGLGYFGWVILSIFGWGVGMVEVSQKTSFFAWQTLLTYGISSVVYFFFLVLLPVVPVGLAIKHLDPVHWSGNGTSKRTVTRSRTRSRKGSQRHKKTSHAPEGLPGLLGRVLLVRAT